MDYIVSTRSDLVSDAMKTYAEKTMLSVVEFYPKIISVSVILDSQKERFSAEVVVYGAHIDIEAKHEAFEMRDSIDKVADKIDKQLRRYLDKVQNHHKPVHNKDVRYLNELVDPEERELANFEE